MSVIRIDEFRALNNRHEDLRLALGDILLVMRAAVGCASVQVFQGSAEPERVVIIEEWLDEAARQAAMEAVSSSQLHRVMALLAELPTGGYFQRRS